MKRQIDPIQRLSNEFSKLPGVGSKTASRFAYHIIRTSKENAQRFAEAILDVKENVQLCPVCGNYLEKENPCIFCNDRKQNTICVVSEPKDVWAIEKLSGFEGTFHVLHGTISPLEGKGPNDLKIKELLNRVSNGNVDEVILATNPDVEGEATALYIARILKPFSIKTTRIAQGVSHGSDIEFADEVTLSKAFEGRTTI